MWELNYEESWVPKNDAFELWCWRRLLRVPWTARRSNQSILKEISPGCSLEGLMLKLKLQYFGHLMRSVDSLEKTLTLEGLGAGGEGDDRGWDGWMASLTPWAWVWVNSGSWWWTGKPGMLRFMGSQSRTRLSDWTELNWIVREEQLTVPSTAVSPLLLFLPHSVFPFPSLFILTLLFLFILYNVRCSAWIIQMHLQIMYALRTYLHNKANS